LQDSANNTGRLFQGENLSASSLGLHSQSRLAPERKLMM
jgi:hypothetical protein